MLKYVLHKEFKSYFCFVFLYFPVLVPRLAGTREIGINMTIFQLCHMLFSHRAPITDEFISLLYRGQLVVARQTWNLYLDSTKSAARKPT
ncbi:hypothetical protein EDD18DRAFT_849314 [Armillaria luteobubalina]|uniref:Uncharacterized protein n=1 Tax=Armillaria luteobubalina TaxID=153913 RepID=A0AA39QAL0_9AGAR|nr:hypothetical protein EDD18DRAFT_849314 [Armillaria luteobubalina]